MSNKSKVLQMASQHSRQLSHPLKKGYSKPNPNSSVNNNDNSFIKDNNAAILQ